MTSPPKIGTTPDLNPLGTPETVTRHPSLHKYIQAIIRAACMSRTVPLHKYTSTPVTITYITHPPHPLQIKNVIVIVKPPLFLHPPRKEEEPQDPIQFQPDPRARRPLPQKSDQLQQRQDSGNRLHRRAVQQENHKPRHGRHKGV